jgi:hypothetical protein
MERIVHIDEKGRKYDAWKGDADMVVIIGPPEGIVDVLGLPEPFATNLHNVLHARGLFNYRIVSSKPQMLTGALQETLMIDMQRLNEAYFRYEQDGGSND